MKRAGLVAFFACLAAGAGALAATGSGVVSVGLPKPDTHFNAGPGVDLARRHCLTCHSSDYVYTQPPLTKAQWTAEVTKMQKTYGAPIPDADVAPLVDYLMTQNGKS
jgi:hypothetical protein